MRWLDDGALNQATTERQDRNTLPWTAAAPKGFPAPAGLTVPA